MAFCRTVLGAAKVIHEEQTMKLDVTGIIVKEKDLSDSDKVITLLTREKGVITAIAKRSKTIRNRLGGMVQLFAYGTFTLFSARNGYLLDGCEIKEVFFELRNDLEALSLAQYFCELSLALRPEVEVSGELLRVLLNSIFYLSKNKMNQLVVKSIFELRACSLCGYMPGLVSCDKCGSYEAENMRFLIEKGKIFCYSCSRESDFGVDISPSMLAVLRHIVYCPVEKLFSFSISDETAEKLEKITDKYVAVHTEGSFRPLEFYKKLKNFKV